MGLVDKLTQEFDVHVEWVPFEIHPETPTGGMPLVKMFPQADPEAMTRRLISMGAPYDSTFRQIVTIANSRLALETEEFAKQQGRFSQFHRAVFEAYFTQGRDIGSLEVLLEIGKLAGLDVDGLGTALRAGTFRTIVFSGKEEASRIGVTAAPTFIINDRDRIVGAQPVEVFRDRLTRMQIR